ncbi:unnamed protein product [Caenorhabditis auriculariae]|uniref:Uncharacterized protein n=1 Tax=Caenorhabditis auriculariae TaxID=2777116 RepID=A0A8S1HLQ9_9PELO|nr:unnamed protein product [Caenorhabditis auriculariae]
MRDRLDPLRRVNSLDEPLKNVGVVRNIPIRIVEQKTPEPPTSSFSTPLNDPPVARFFDDVGRRFSDFPASQPREIRRTVR